MNLPDEIGDSLARLVDPVECFITLCRVLFIHKFAEILEFYLFSGVSENFAERIIEILKPSAEIHFIKALLDVSDKILVSVNADMRVPALIGIAIELFHPTRIKRWFVVFFIFHHFFWALKPRFSSLTYFFVFLSLTRQKNLHNR